MPAGRKTAYKKEYAEQTYKLCLLGATDSQLSDFFGVSEQTINAWKKNYPEFLESIKKGKETADAEIAHSLYHRAKGYKHKEDKIFNNNGDAMIVPTTKHYPPDTAAAFIWLKNRTRGKEYEWNDKQEIAVTGLESLGERMALANKRIEDAD